MQELHALVEKFNTNCVDGSMLLDYCEEEDFDVLIPFAPLRRKFKRCHEDLVRQADIGPGLEESITTMELHHGLKQLNETMHIIATALTQQQGQAHVQQGQTSFTYAAAPVTRPTHVPPAAAVKATEVMIKAEPTQTLMAVQSQEARAEPARSQAPARDPRETQEKATASQRTESVHAGEASVREVSRPALARALAAPASEPSPLATAPVTDTGRKSLKETAPATTRDRNKTKAQAAPVLAGAAVAAAAGMAVGASLHPQTERSLADEEGEEHWQVSGEDEEAEAVDLAQAKELEQQRAADEAKRIKKERMEKMRKRKEARLKEEQKLKKEVRTRSRSRSRDCSESLCPCWFPKLSSSSVCRQIA